MAEDRWEQLVEGAVGGPVTAGTMFGSRGLRTGRKFFAIWWHEKLVAKLPPARLQRLVDDGDAEPFEPMAGRPMAGWAILSPGLDWPGVVEEARSFVASQPSR